MAQFQILNGVTVMSVIDTAGNNQPVSAASNPSPFAQSVPPVATTSSGVGATSDLKTTTANTNQPIANRA